MKKIFPILLLLSLMIPSIATKSLHSCKKLQIFRCHLHRTMMKIKRVPIRYGKPAYMPKSMAAKKRLFPNSKMYISGGCIVTSGLRMKLVYACPHCRTARKKWIAAHKKGTHIGFLP